MGRSNSGLARSCSSNDPLGEVSTPHPLLRNPSHLCNTTAAAAGMCFLLCSGRSRNWPTLRPLSPSRTLRSTKANSPRLICLLFFPLRQWVAVRHGLHFMFIVPFWLRFPFYRVFLEGVMFWLWTSSPRTAFFTHPRLVSR